MPPLSMHLMPEEMLADQQKHRLGVSLRRHLELFRGPIRFSRSRSIGVSQKIGAVTSLISSLEYVVRLRRDKTRRYDEWYEARASYHGQPRPVRWIAEVFSDRRLSMGLQVSRAVLSVGALAMPSRHLRLQSSMVLASGILGVLTYPRNRYGSDGSDQATTITQILVGAAGVDTVPARQDALLWGVSLQSSLSYAVAGWAKLVGEQWRSGTALVNILRTRTYGHEASWNLVRRFPKTSKALSHFVLAFECLFPLVYVAPPSS